MLKGAALKLMYRSVHARMDDSAVVQFPPGDVGSGLKMGWERQDKGKPWLILRCYCTVRQQDYKSTTEGSVGRSCGLTAA
jgi:hypothetical protein